MHMHMHTQRPSRSSRAGEGGPELERVHRLQPTSRTRAATVPALCRGHRRRLCAWGVATATLGIAARACAVPCACVRALWRPKALRVPGDAAGAPLHEGRL
eukprot:1284955-Pleurochrysis_carterae.AAC.3